MLVLFTMAEKENSAFRLHRFIERMLSQGQNIQTAQVLLNAFGVKEQPKAVWSQSAMVLRVASLLFAEVRSLKEELTRAGFTGKSLELIDAAFDRLSVAGMPQQWQNHSAFFKACLNPPHIFGEGLPDEGAHISNAELTDLQKVISDLREEVQKSDLRQEVKNFVYEQLNIIERAINDYPVTGMKAFKVAVREGVFHEAEHAEIVIELQNSPQMLSLKKIIAKVVQWSGYTAALSKLLSSGDVIYDHAEKGAHALAKHAHQVSLWLQHLKK